ncbi:unnamed protein product (macronuclear) [Paramecium tetraurelia]|uniref:Uncharacterized protein n=1 Tax=Paramecium tetraurelia TaxID=5888 RepID=A0CTD3_PARTE|nr:uncharacterized protein GSPATT00010284001 [Paramecium tetraurelia]CAK74050.1 unnamed protein product [Paramecium tetraurelia]|eukprot:XP_001441447.1 hypothetical protein (macronuclear) [Paramecium tetraurelia strain d4-2]
MKNELQALYDQGQSKKTDPTNIGIFIPNFLNKLIALKKMIGSAYEQGRFIAQEEDLFGNKTEFDDDFLRALTLNQWNQFLAVNIEVTLLQPDQQMLSFSKRIDIIQNFLLSFVNSKSNGLAFYSYLDQIYVKYNIYLPNAITLKMMNHSETNHLIQIIDERYRLMELQIMSYKDQLLSALALDQQEIQEYFPQQLDLYYNYKNDNIQIPIDQSLKYESLIARECEIFQDQIQIDGGEQRSINTLSETDQEIAKNGNNNSQILQNLNYRVKVYTVEARVGLLNQGHFRNYQEILGGELFQEFERQPITQQIQRKLEFEDSIHIPQADPRYKNVLQEQLPDVSISILRRLLILKEALLIIIENQRQLANLKFKGKLSVLVKIRFCNVLGTRPIFIMRKIKKEKKQIDDKNHIHNYKIIKSLIYVLFFKDRYDDEIRPIHHLCCEFLHSFCQGEPDNSQDSDQETEDSRYILKNLPDIDKYLVKLEKLILLINKIYCVPF